jgi:hypothetical protein
MSDPSMMDVYSSSRMDVLFSVQFLIIPCAKYNFAIEIVMTRLKTYPAVV